MVGQESILCTIHCQDGTTYPIRSCLRGKIIEINKCLVNEPSLIVEKVYRIYLFNYKKLKKNKIFVNFGLFV